MKYMKRKQVYQASNVTFNPKNTSAWSYGWWQFVKVIEGKVIFNDYFYSQSTNGHQSKVQRLLQTLNIKIDYIVEVHLGLQNYDSLEALFLDSEIELCDQFLHQEYKKIRRAELAKERKAEALKKQLQEQFTLNTLNIFKTNESLITDSLKGY